jgi:hypothetical protein
MVRLRVSAVLLALATLGPATGFALEGCFSPSTTPPGGADAGDDATDDVATDAAGDTSAVAAAAAPDSTVNEASVDASDASDSSADAYAASDVVADVAADAVSEAALDAAPEADTPLVLFQDDFDGETSDSSVGAENYTGFAKWDVTSGSVDITVLPNPFIASPGGYGAGLAANGFVVDLNGSTNADGTLATKNALNFSAGLHYTLRYALGNARAQSNSVTVTIAGLVNEMRTQSTTNPFTAYQTSFTPASDVSAKLVFASQGGNDLDGLLLDSVSIESP